MPRFRFVKLFRYVCKHPSLQGKLVQKLSKLSLKDLRITWGSGEGLTVSPQCCLLHRDGVTHEDDNDILHRDDIWDDTYREIS